MMELHSQVVWNLTTYRNNHVMDLVRQSGAELAGMGFLIEKAFQHGGDYLRAQGIHVESLAVIESLEGCRITLKE